MTIKSFFPLLLTGIYTLTGCNGTGNVREPEAQTSQHKMVTEQTLKDILDAFNRHDLDAIMEYFADDCSFDFPRGPEPWGERFTGKVDVRAALASRFKGIPDAHYGEDSHWVSADGDKGLSEWTLTGTTVSGTALKVRGCDLWEFRNGKVTRKNSFWKIVEQRS